MCRVTVVRGVTAAATCMAASVTNAAGTNKAASWVTTARQTDGGQANAESSDGHYPTRTMARHPVIQRWTLPPSNGHMAMGATHNGQRQVGDGPPPPPLPYPPPVPLVLETELYATRFEDGCRHGANTTQNANCGSQRAAHGNAPDARTDDMLKIMRATWPPARRNIVSP